jgi:hypothetical protein
MKDRMTLGHIADVAESAALTMADGRATERIIEAILDKGDIAAPKSSIVRVVCEGHESDPDILFDGGKVMIEGKGLAGATECTILCKDVAGNEHSSTYHHIDPEFTATDTLVTIDVDMIASEMRNLCSEADSSIDINAGATVKLTLSNGTELTRSVAIGE